MKALAVRVARLEKLVAGLLAHGGGSSSSKGGSTANNQSWKEATIAVIAGTSNVVTDTTPTVQATVSGTFLVNGFVSATANAGTDNGSFAYVQHSTDGGATWAPITAPPEGDERCPFDGLPAPTGLAAAIITIATFSVIVKLPTAVGSANGVKFRVVASVSGGVGSQMNFTIARGGLTAVELAA